MWRHHNLEAVACDVSCRATVKLIYMAGIVTPFPNIVYALDLSLPVAPVR
ncbi:MULTISPECIES: hypothetical protein [Mesorhizobium]|nr:MULTISPECIES: hypothetical protein [Mesorhizobium]MCA0030337.1 hypothetical protein [Mesorhizobium sp. B263B2A]